MPQARDIANAPQADLGLIVVIPCHDEPDILGCLQSLADCAPALQGVEVIVVVNGAAHQGPAVLAQNQRSLAEIKAWQAQAKDLPFCLYSLDYPDLPRKHAGVGLARRIGMDLAAERFFLLGRPEGVIVNLDADCRVAPNYLQALESHFLQLPQSPGATLWFEHPLQGELSSAHYQAIAYYELFLRYHIAGLRYAGLPSAFQTIGSAMAVRAAIYRAQGGMNRRKAGEDFYFLHKVIALGGFSELNHTTVYPSPRVSQRVPFGTGKAVGDWLAHQNGYPAYTLQTYLDLRTMVTGLGDLYAQGPDFISTYLATLSTPLQAFLQATEGDAKIAEIFANSASESSFQKRFFHWFNGFRAMKCAHFLRDTAYGEKELLTQALHLLQLLASSPDLGDAPTAFELLQAYRTRDRRWAA